MTTQRMKKTSKLRLPQIMRMTSKIENDPKINDNPHNKNGNDLKMKTIQRHTAIPFVALHYFFSLIIL